MAMHARVDTSGRYCPVPILELAKALRPLEAGAIVELVATDPAVQEDLRAWCQATGHELLGLERAGQAYIARIRKVGEGR